MLEPLKMNPCFKEKLWGGSTLKTKYNKPITSDHTGESWEVSAHDNGQSVVANGEFAGKTFGEVIKLMGKELLGDYVAKHHSDKFPLLVKFLDCTDKLSVQVHPNDEYAGKNENGELGKTEMWYVLDAKPGAKLIYGFCKDVTREEFDAAIKNGDLDNILNYVDANVGDSFFIKSQTLHALLDGLLIAEIQQNSDTTYRVYDFNRKDKDGNTRELHIEKSLDVTNMKSSKGSEKVQIKTENLGENTKANLAKCNYFVVDRYCIKNEITLETNRQSFDILTVCDGNGSIVYDGGKIDFVSGDSFVVPAYLGKYTIYANATILKSYVPSK